MKVNIQCMHIYSLYSIRSSVSVKTRAVLRKRNASIKKCHKNAKIRRCAWWVWLVMYIRCCKKCLQENIWWCHWPINIMRPYLSIYFLSSRSPEGFILYVSMRINLLMHALQGGMKLDCIT